MTCCDYCGTDFSTPNYAYHICAPNYLHRDDSGTIATSDGKLILRMAKEKVYGFHIVVMDCEDNWAEIEAMTKKSRGIPQKVAKWAMAVKKAQEEMEEEAMRLATLYVECGTSIGFFATEMILMKHLPEGMGHGKCADVSQENRPALIRDMENAKQYGVVFSPTGMQIFDEVQP